MFIKNLTCNYSAQKLLSIASRLNFALNAWVALILYCFYSEKKRDTRYFNPFFWVYMITLPLAQPTIMIQFLIIFNSISHKNPPLNINLPIILIFLIFYNICWPFPST